MPRQSPRKIKAHDAVPPLPAPPAPDVTRPAQVSPYKWSSRGRCWRTLLGLAGVWFVILLFLLVFDAAIWLMLFVMFFTLPALYDLVADPRAGLSLDEKGLHWYFGRRAGQLGIEEIDHVRLDTRLDFSVRATAVLKTGRKHRLPFECTPPHRDLEKALETRGISIRRHHFLPVW